MSHGGKTFPSPKVYWGGSAQGGPSSRSPVHINHFVFNKFKRGFPHLATEEVEFGVAC